MRRSIPPILAFALLLPSPAAASTSSGAAALIQDCLRNGKITGHYTQRDYAQALANLPTDVAQYSDCAQVIRRAQLAAAGGQQPPGASSPANPRANPLVGASPAARAALVQAQRSGAAPINVGGALIRPGIVPVRASSITSVLPTPLLVVLGALLSIALAWGGQHVRDLVRARRSR